MQQPVCGPKDRRLALISPEYPPESADSGLDRSDRSENAPKTGKIVKIARFGPTEGPTTDSAGLQNQVSSAI
jgi:hypothetical protein